VEAQSNRIDVPAMIAGSYFAEESNEQNDEMAADDQI